jgi:nucleotide-binding universal stress UspA family protein
LKEQIEVHRHWLSRKQGQPTAYREAVTHWYDDLYLPTIQIIRQRGILRDFPERTETDLYVWLSNHQIELKQVLGWEVEPEMVAYDLVTRFSTRPKRVLARLKEKLVDALTPDPMEAGPPPGRWREEHLAIHPDERLFPETLCLVPVDNNEPDWRAFGQALVVVRREQGRLHGLHVGSLARPENHRQAKLIQAEFRERCQVAGLKGELSFESGNVTRQICERGRWVDLIVISLRHPPAPQPAARLKSGFRTLIRRCSRPVLAVTGSWSHLSRPLLAYDGSPKANEALFVAAYLAGRWQVPLTVVTVIGEGQATRQTLAEAQSYLEKQGVQATLVPNRGPVAQAIIKTAETSECDLIIMGGYGFSPVLEVMFGSELDQVLQARRWPVLICR